MGIRMPFIVGLITLGMAFFHLYAGGIQLFPAMQQRSIHLALGSAIVFLLYPWIKRDGERGLIEQNWLGTLFNCLLALASIFVGAYVASRYLDLHMELSSPTTLTLIVSTIIIVITLEATRRTIGWPLPIICLIFLAYAFLGEHLPLIVQHSGYSFERIVTTVGLSNQGILGTALGVSANYIILFVIFGSLLERSGAGKLFIDLAMALVGRFRGGPAKVSVAASAFFGTISGSQVSNVVTTGVLTIPLMKRAGYSSAFAGAVESAASSGGIMLPPVMGAVAFLAAEILQVSYATVAWAAMIPAVLYFLGIFLMVDLRAAKMGLSTTEEVIHVSNVKALLLAKGHLLLPILVLVYLLMVQQLSPNVAAFWAIVSIPVSSWLRKETRMNVWQIVEALQSGVKLSLVVVTACSAAGIVIGVVNMTGMGLRFSGMLLDFAGGSLLLLCLFTAVATIIMGMGVPPVAAYLFLAILAAPALIDFGVHPLAAHLFIFYYSTLSGITPPVALAAFAASGIAKAGPISIAFNACRLAAVGFIIPFMFIFSPALIMEGSVAEIIIAGISALIGVYALSVALEGYITDQVGLLSHES